MYFLVDCQTPELQDLLKFIYNILDLIKIAIPILLIIMGSIDLGKAVVAGKDDEIKKAQSTLVKRAIAAVAVFFVATLVGLLFSILGKGEVCQKPTSFNINNSEYVAYVNR